MRARTQAQAVQFAIYFLPKRRTGALCPQNPRQPFYAKRDRTNCCFEQIPRQVHGTVGPTKMACLTCRSIDSWNNIDHQRYQQERRRVIEASRAVTSLSKLHRHCHCHYHNHHRHRHRQQQQQPQPTTATGLLMSTQKKKRNDSLRRKNKNPRKTKNKKY